MSTISFTSNERERKGRGKRERKSGGRKCSIDTIEQEMKAQLYRWKSIVGKRFACSREKEKEEEDRRREKKRDGWERELCCNWILRSHVRDRARIQRTAQCSPVSHRKSSVRFCRTTHHHLPRVKTAILSQSARRGRKRVGTVTWAGKNVFLVLIERGSVSLLLFLHASARGGIYVCDVLTMCFLSSLLFFFLFFFSSDRYVFVKQLLRNAVVMKTRYVVTTLWLEFCQSSSRHVPELHSHSAPEIFAKMLPLAII